MKVLRVIPFVLIPFVSGCEQKSQLSQRPPAVRPLIQDQNLILADSFKIPDLTPEESKALNEAEDFLKKYTGNGKFNYGTIPRLIEGLTQDYDGIHEEARTRKGLGLLQRNIAKNYPNNSIEYLNERVRKEVASRGSAEISQKLSEFGVDPSTANKPDDSPNVNLVTKEKLDKFDVNFRILSKMLRKSLPPDKRVILREGFNLDAAKSIQGKNPGLPPGAEIVEMVSTSAVGTIAEPSVRALTQTELEQNRFADKKTDSDSVNDQEQKSTFYYLTAKDGNRYLIHEILLDEDEAKVTVPQNILEKDQKGNLNWVPLSAYPEYYKMFLDSKK